MLEMSPPGFLSVRGLGGSLCVLRDRPRVRVCADDMLLSAELTHGDMLISSSPYPHPLIVALAVQDLGGGGHQVSLTRFCFVSLRIQAEAFPARQ